MGQDNASRRTARFEILSTIDSRQFEIIGAVTAEHFIGVCHDSAPEAPPFVRAFVRGPTLSLPPILLTLAPLSRALYHTARCRDLAYAQRSRLPHWPAPACPAGSAAIAVMLVQCCRRERRRCPLNSGVCE